MSVSGWRCGCGGQKVRHAHLLGFHCTGIHHGQNIIGWIDVGARQSCQFRNFTIRHRASLMGFNFDISVLRLLSELGHFNS